MKKAQYGEPVSGQLVNDLIAVNYNVTHSRSPEVEQLLRFTHFGKPLQQQYFIIYLLYQGPRLTRSMGITEILDCFLVLTFCLLTPDYLSHCSDICITSSWE